MLGEKQAKTSSDSWNTLSFRVDENTEDRESGEGENGVKVKILYKRQGMKEEWKGMKSKTMCRKRGKKTDYKGERS